MNDLDIRLKKAISECIEKHTFRLDAVVDGSPHATSDNSDLYEQRLRRDIASMFADKAFEILPKPVVKKAPWGQEYTMHHQLVLCDPKELYDHIANIIFREIHFHRAVGTPIIPALVDHLKSNGSIDDRIRTCLMSVLRERLDREPDYNEILEFQLLEAPHVKLGQEYGVYGLIWQGELIGGIKITETIVEFRPIRKQEEES